MDKLSWLYKHGALKNFPYFLHSYLNGNSYLSLSCSLTLATIKFQSWRWTVHFHDQGQRIHVKSGETLVFWVLHFLIFVIVHAFCDSSYTHGILVALACFLVVSNSFFGYHRYWCLKLWFFQKNKIRWLQKLS